MNDTQQLAALRIVLIAVGRIALAFVTPRGAKARALASVAPWLK